MESFATIVSDKKPWTIVAKLSILDVCRVAEYANDSAVIVGSIGMKIRHCSEMGETLK